MGRLGLGLAVGCAVASCAVAALLVARRAAAARRWFRALEVVRGFEEACDAPVVRLKQVVDAMVVEMHAGLASDGGSKLKMLLTYVDALPNGSEEGAHYAIDLGGTYLRVLRVELGGESREISHEVERYEIPEELTTGTTEELFDFIAVSLKQFVEKEGYNEPTADERTTLGFTFSFPVKQYSISSGSLIRWTKGYSIPDVGDKDIAQCLNESISKVGLDIRVTVLVNDTVGTLALGHYYDQDTVAAVIIGTGTNACYFERTDAIIKCQGLLTSSGGMVINMEWGNFWTAHLPRTPYDTTLDGCSPNPNEQGFEKMISGMYLGEIVRRVLVSAQQEGEIFPSPNLFLHTAYILSARMMAVILSDDSPDLKQVALIFEEFQIHNISLKTRLLIRSVCDTVTKRAARLVAAGIVGILKKMGRNGSAGVASGRTGRIKLKRSVVAIEGGMYEGFSAFKEYLHSALKEILGEDVAENVSLLLTRDGSGIGAALLAAAAADSSDRQVSI